MQAKRSAQLPRGAFAVWMTGLSGAGKTTLARALIAELKGRGLRCELLDGDEVRAAFFPELGFSRADREKNLRRIAALAEMLLKHEVVAVVSTISPYKAIREEARQRLGNFVEVFVDCPLEICANRDVKGLYRRAQAGEIEAFTGTHDPYERPENPEVRLATHDEGAERSLAKLKARLHELGYLA